MVVGERVGLAGISVSDLEAVRAGVDRCDLGVDAHVEVERSLEGLRGVEKELGGVFDLAADVVREPAVREGHVFAALQHDDLGALIAPAQACRRAHTTRDSSDDNYSHMRLTFCLNGLLLSTASVIPPGYRWATVDSPHCIPGSARHIEPRTSPTTSPTATVIEAPRQDL